MTRNVKLAVIRATHDGTTIPDDACREFVMIGSRSLFRYWSDTTDGWLDFLDSAMFPWVTVTVPPTAVDRYSTTGSAVAALRAANPGHDPLAGYAGLLVLLHPGVGAIANPQAGTPGQPATLPNTGFDGGSGDLGGLPFSLIPTTVSDHTFFCHELGHTLGALHTWGLENSGVDWAGTGATSPEYGSPYDLMSSASFGTRSGGQRADPTFTGATVTGWPGPAGGIGMGPALSRANLHRCFPDALARSTREAPFPADGDTDRYRLLPASSGSGTTLLILHPPDEPATGSGRVYIEYRTAQGWDEGLSGARSGIARPGVVVHSLDDVPGHGPRVWYRGAVLDDDPDTDLAVAARPLVVGVTGRGEDGERWIEVSVRTAALRSAHVRIERSDRVTGQRIAVRREETPCGDTVTWGTWATVSTARCRAVTTGLEPPITAPTSTVSWSVGGVPLAGTGATQVPSAGGTRRVVSYSVDAGTQELTLVSAEGEAYSIEVTATVRDLVGTGTFTAPGTYTGLNPDDLRPLAQCAAVHPQEIVEFGRIDVESLLDGHEAWRWKEAENALAGLVAGASGPVAERFRQIMNVTVDGSAGLLERADLGAVELQPGLERLEIGGLDLEVLRDVGAG